MVRKASGDRDTPATGGTAKPWPSAACAFRGAAGLRLTSKAVDDDCRARSVAAAGVGSHVQALASLSPDSVAPPRCCAHTGTCDVPAVCRRATLSSATDSWPVVKSPRMRTALSPLSTSTIAHCVGASHSTRVLALSWSHPARSCSGTVYVRTALPPSAA